MHKANVPFEVKLKGSYTHHSKVSVSKSGKKITVYTFTKGGGKSFFRFSGSEGRYKYKIFGENGSFAIGSYKGTNILLKKGGICLSKNKKSLIHANGEPFFYLADTLWYGATSRILLPEFKKYLAFRKKQGFSAIQIVAGTPPEINFNSKQAANEKGLPFLSNLLPNPTYFDALDERIQEIVIAGLVPVIFGGWGQHIDIIGVEKTKIFWNEIIARYSAYPVIFSLAGELDVFLEGFGDKEKSRKWMQIIPSYLILKLRRMRNLLVHKPDDTTLLEIRARKWKEVANYIKGRNSFQRLLTAHISQKKSVFELVGSDSLDFDSIQSGHSKDSIFYMKEKIRNSLTPIINLEPWYEGILGNFTEYDQRRAFWTCILSGAIGHAYGAHGVWQIEHGDNFMEHWGKSTFKKAVNYKGATQLGQSRKFLEKLAYQMPFTADKRIEVQSATGFACSKVNKHMSILYLEKAQGELIVNFNKKTTVKWINPVDFKTILTENTSSGGKLRIPNRKHDLLAAIQYEQTH